MTPRRWLAISGLLFAVVLLRTAWISDDACITLRTVDNFVHGRGPTWNPDERVQAYTHPLWMFALSGAYALTREAFYTPIALSIAVSLAAILLLARRLAAGPASALLAVAVLVSSKAFVDFSTSGLENPLAHLLLVLFLVAYLDEARAARRPVLVVLAASALALNRLDSLLLVLPAVGLALRAAGRRAPRALALGILPLVLWEAFSLLYYGFPLPNPAYAKLGTGIARADLAAEGVAYLRNSLAWDPVTLAATAIGATLAVSARRPRETALAAGILLHVAYVVFVGGDFMSGRFLTPPLLVAVVLIARRPLPAPRRWVPAAVALAAATVLLPRSPLRSGAAYGMRGEMMDGQIADERGVYFQRCGLLRAGPGRGLSDHPHAVGARETARIAPPVAVAGNIGIYGYYVGPGVHLIDAFALADPLLARLPVRSETWRVGHYVRAIPPGYGDSLVDGVNRIEDTRLAEYWTHLCVLTRGPLLSRARLAEIARFQVGRYRPLVEPFFESYREQHAGMRLLDAGTPGPAIARFEAAVALDSTRAAAWWGLARARIATGDPEPADPAARSAVRHGQGRFDEVLVQAAAESHRAGRPDLAVPALLDYLALHDDGLEARLMLALAFERLGDTDRALGEYERVAGTRPGVREVEDRIHVLRAGQVVPPQPPVPSE